jgi:predicted N-formylglutamate amidohydrolase
LFKGVSRPWHAGVLYNRDPRLARLLLALLNADDDLLVGDNEPYVVDNATDYTIPVHGERRRLPHVLLEIRQDLIEDESGQREWALRLACLLPKAYESLRWVAWRQLPRRQALLRVDRRADSRFITL